MNQREKIYEMNRIFERCLEGIDEFIHLPPTSWLEATLMVENAYQQLRRYATGQEPATPGQVRFHLDELAVAAAAAKILREEDYNRHSMPGRIKAVFTQCLVLADAKGHDYAGNDDACSNLRDFGWQGVVVRLSDKAHRLKNFIKQGVLQVKDEAITDTLRDIVNYAALTCIVMELDTASEEAA